MHQDLKKQQQQQTSTTTQLLCLPLTGRTWTVRRDIGHHITSCSAIKAVEEEGAEVAFKVATAFSPSFHTCWAVFILTPEFFHFCSSCFLLLSCWGRGVSKWLPGCLAAGRGQPTSHLNPPSAVRRGLQGSSEHRVSFTWFPQEAFLPGSSLGIIGESLNLMERQ